MSVTEPVRFAYRVPDVSGGLVTSTVEQRTVRSYDCNREVDHFGRRVLPLVREWEAGLPDGEPGSVPAHV